MERLGRLEEIEEEVKESRREGKVKAMKAKGKSEEIWLYL